MRNSAASGAPTSRRNVSFASPGDAKLTLRREVGAPEAAEFRIRASAPGVFLTSIGIGWESYTPQPLAGTAVRVEADGSQTSLPLFSCDRGANGVHCTLTPIVRDARPV